MFRAKFTSCHHRFAVDLNATITFNATVKPQTGALSKTDKNSQLKELDFSPISPMTMTMHNKVNFKIS